jgi:sec-independent protein translocase protein TatC
VSLLLRSPGKRKKRDSQASMTIVEHLEDLRRALIIAIVAWILCSVAAWFFTDQILLFIEHRANIGNLTYFGPTGAFMTRFKVAVAAGTLVASPIIFWQLWWFVGPGLHTHEKKVVLPLIGATTLFFLLGVSFCFYSLPLIMRVLGNFAHGSGLQFLPVTDDFLGFLLGLCIAFGIVFEMPVVLWTLGMLRIISSAWLWKQRLYWVIALGLLANLMTPGGDPLTPLLIFVPLIVFYLGTMLLLKISGR